MKRNRGKDIHLIRINLHNEDINDLAQLLSAKYKVVNYTNINNDELLLFLQPPINN